MESDWIAVRRLQGFANTYDKEREKKGNDKEYIGDVAANDKWCFHNSPQRKMS